MFASAAIEPDSTRFYPILPTKLFQDSYNERKEIILPQLQPTSIELGSMEPDRGVAFILFITPKFNVVIIMTSKAVDDNALYNKEIAPN